MVDKSNTVDKIIIGDPQKEINKILVAWTSNLRAINAAIAGGYDMLITHEPTFWFHAHEVTQLEQMDKDFAKKQTGLAKKKLIEESGLVIARNHDVWDRMPEYGVPWSWARFLELGTQPVRTGLEGFQHRYDIAPITLGELARKIASKTNQLGEPYLQLIGDENQLISKIGIGTGCVCNISVFIEMGCDVAVVCDDGNCYWADLTFAVDAGQPIIRVYHGTSEEPGMISLAAYINRELAPVKAEHLPYQSEIKILSGQTR